MDNLRRILVVKLADLGDLLTATPALRALRQRYPGSEITALVSPHAASLLVGNDAVDHVVTFPKAIFDDVALLARPDVGWMAAHHAGALARRLHSARFDAVVLLHHLYTAWGRLKYRGLLAATGAPIRVGLGSADFLTHRVADAGFGGRHEVDYWLEVVGQLGAVHRCPRLELHLSQRECELARRRWKALGLADRSVIAIHPGSGRFSVARRWPPERFAEVGEALAGDGHAIAVVAGPGEEHVAQRVLGEMRTPGVILHGLADPRELAALLSHCRLFVGNDSGVMHMAVAVGVPCVSVFGLSNHRAWGPYPPGRHRVVRLELPCSPCFYPDSRLGTPQGCAARLCLMHLPALPVVSAARELLACVPIR